MSKLRVSRVSIRNAPGFEQSGFNLEQLDHAINLVYGPNAAGKTTAIRAMKLLLWPQAAEKSEYLKRCHVDGELISENKRWFAESSFGRSFYQQGGSDVRRPETFLSAEFAQRYTLALHELMQADNHTFAQLIQRESIGGFDLEQVGTAIGAQQKLSNKNIKPAKDYQEARKLYREHKRAVEQLQAREHELTQLQGELERAQSASHLVQLYELLREYKQASLRYDEQVKEKETYNRALEYLNSSDFEQVRSLSDTIEKRTEDIERAKEERERLEADLQALRFSPSEEFAVLLETWKEDCKRLDTLQRDADEHKQKSSEAEVTVAESRRALGPSLADSSWEGLSFPDLTQMQKLQREAEELQAVHTALKRQLHQLPPTEQSEKQQKKIKLLDKLLPLISNSLQPTLVAAAILLLLGSAAAAYTLTPLGALLVAGGGSVCAIVAFTRFFARRKQAYHLRSQLEELGFEQESLSFSQVHSTAAKELSKQQFTELMETYRKQLTSDLEFQEQAMAEFREKEEQIRSQIGALPTFLDDTHSLSYFLEQAANLQKATSKQQEAEYARTTALDQIQLILDSLAETWAPWYSGTCTTVAEAQAGLRILEKKFDSHTRLSSELKQAKKQQQHSEQLLKEATTQLQSIYAKAELDKESDPLGLLASLEPQHEDYSKLASELDKQSWECTRVLGRLHAHESFEDQQLKEPFEHIESKLTHFEQQAARYDELSKKITEIETLLDQQKISHATEEALAKLDRSSEALAEKRQGELESLIGGEILVALKDQSLTEDRPEVFHAADSLFQQLTAGQYTLMLDGERFRAEDTVRRKSLDLDELSSGTRVQLLLAVRVAFISRNEQGLKLPLFVDEVLANSDDRRSATIIRTLIEIAASGRQVFYVTAQSDEIARWRAVLDEYSEAVDYHIQQLHPESMESPLREKPGIEPLKFSFDPPQPGSATHTEYGTALHVPHYQFLTEPVDALHVWYSIEDTKLLYELAKRGIHRLGQLKQFLSTGGKVEFLRQDTREFFGEAEHLLQEAVRLYRTGRNRPVPEYELEASGAVSDTFLLPVTKLLRSVSGDPKQLLEGLGTIPKFRQNKIDELRQYLLQEGYLSSRSPYSSDEIQTHLQAVLSGMNQLDHEHAERLLQRVFS